MELRERQTSMGTRGHRRARGHRHLPGPRRAGRDDKAERAEGARSAGRGLAYGFRRRGRFTALGDDWIIDKGHSYPGGPGNWGTGEIQEYTDSPENLQLDGDGHLKITALKNGDNWTSGPYRDQAHRLRGPRGRRHADRGRPQTARRLRRRGPGLLAGVLDPR